LAITYLDGDALACVWTRILLSKKLPAHVNLLVVKKVLADAARIVEERPPRELSVPLPEFPCVQAHRRDLLQVPGACSATH
jgi:hypothetical protein